MKKVLFLLSFLCLYVAGSHAAATARIMAYDLRLTTEGENYTFTFKANEAPTEATLVFYSVGTGKIIGEKPLAGIVKGANSITLSRNELPGGGTMNWGVKLHAGAIESFGLVYADASLTYARAYANVDAHPESDYFGKVYVADRKPTKSQSRLYVYDQTYNKNATAHLLGESLWAFGRFAIAENGKLYLSDYSDDHSGCYIVDPADLDHATQFFAGTRGGSGLFTYNSTVETGSSLAATHIYGKGKDAKLFAVAEDYTGYSSNKFPVAIYNIGNADGTLKESWTTAPNVLYQTLGNGAQNFDVRGCEKGAWVATSRAAGQNNASYTSLRFYDFDGNCKYTSSDHIDIINGSMGGGFTITEDGKTMYLVNGNGNILELSISWSGNTPSLSLVRTHTTTYSAISSINVDYAGNLVVTAGSSFNTSSTTQLGLSVYTMPTTDNTCTVPAKKALTVYKPLAGTYKIGGDDANYTSLHAATKDINKCGISADVNLLICANLTEPINPVLTNGTEHTITIRPDADADRKISFTAAADNYGPSGAFIIGGVREIIDGHDTIAWNTSLTNNIHIDGFAEDGTTRRLTFDTPTGHDNTYPILIYGNVHDSYIKNCIINCTKGSGTRAGIIIRTAKNTNTAPQNILIENNLINPSSIAGQGIMFNGSQASTKGIGAPKDCIIRNNRIEVQNKGIYLNGANGLTIENNDFLIAGANGMNAHAIMGDQHNRGDIIIRNNKFNLTTNNAYDNDYGVIGVASSGLAAGQTIQWTIENNYFGGLDAKNASASSKKFKMMYIRCANPTIVRHNTFHIPAFTKSVGMDLVSAYCASAVYLASSSEYIVQNNIFVCEETNSKVSLIRGALNTNIRNNIFYHAGGNGAIVAGTDVYNTYNDLPEAYRTTYNNKNVPVEFSDGYHFTDEYANNFNLGVDRIEGFNYDIEGNVRNIPTRAGCYDPAWSITLDQTASDNTDLLATANNILVDATINRSFTNDGWYTLVLPFDATAEQLTEVFGTGYEVAVLKDSRWKSETDMYLNFVKQANIEAGVPCLIKPVQSTGSEITFHDVTIDNATHDIETELVNMLGLYNQTTITLDDDNYYLGNGNLLYEYNSTYASAYATTNGFRAYFHFNFTPPAGCAPRVMFYEDTATGIEDAADEANPAVQKVLRDGQLIIIRDGKEYNAQGQLVR